MDDRRLFSEEEATNLIVEAARIQEAGPESGDYTPGVSLGELKRMAADLGVKEEYLFQAMAKGSSGRADGGIRRKSFLGFPISMEFERVMEGELPPENFDVVTQELDQIAYANIGQSAITQVGRGLSVKFMKGMATGTIGVQSRGGRTRLSCRAGSELGVTFGILGPFIGAMLGLVPILAKAPASGPIALAVWGLFTLGWFALFGRLSSSSFEVAQQKVEEIATKIAEENDALRQNLASNGGVVSEEEVSIHE